ncbi:MAG: site-2 protease family protein [Candidatus Margulisiibacteriota bacterium]
MKQSFKIFSIHRIPIEINYSWFFILSLVVFTLANGYFPITNEDLPSFAYWIMAFISAILLFASLLAHELSHSIVAQNNGLKIYGITLFIFGGVAHLEKEPPSPAIEFKMAIAGPIMSFMLALFFFILTGTFKTLSFPAYTYSISYYLFWTNLLVGMFNLVPGFPLDGGRVLRSIIWFLYKNLNFATRITSNIGKLFAYLMIGYGLVGVLAGFYLNGIWIIFIGFFLLEAADMSYKQIVMKKIFRGVTVNKLMSKTIVTVPPDISLDHLVDDYFFKYRYASFPVMEEDAILGLATLHNVKEVGRDKWPSTTAAENMIPVTADLIISPGKDVAEALSQMANNEIGKLLVVENEKLVGIISQNDIIKLFKIKSKVEE